MASESKLLDRTSAALVIIDLQAKLVPAIFESERVIRNADRLLRLAEILQIPTVLTTQNAAGLGETVSEIKVLAAGVEPIDKTSFGCFGSGDCVTQTALGTHDAGYLVHVAADAVSSRTPENWRVGLNRMERAGAVMSSTEMMIYELLGKSGTPEFKAMLPFLKQQ